MTLDDRMKAYKKKRFPKMIDLLVNHEMSIRTACCLDAMGIYTVQELITYSEQELLGGRNMGRKSLQEIKEILSSLHLRLKN